MINKTLFQIIIIFITSSTLLAEVMYKDEMYREEMLENGKKIYQSTCISCHGIKGQTDSTMKLVVKPRKLNKTILTPEQSFKIIKEGAHYWGAHSDMMPAFKYVFSDDDIKDISFYISETFNQNRDNRIKKLLKDSSNVSKKDKLKMLKVGEKIFKRNCSLCHGVTGNGDSHYIKKSKESNIFIYPYNLQRTLLNEKQIFLYAKYGGYFWGTHKKDMPSWKKKYDDIKLKSVAKYISQKIKQIKD